MAEKGVDPDIISPVEEVGEEALEAGRLLFTQRCRFVAGAASVATLPAGDLPEVAFAGRSNVGKSSLINALTGQTRLVRISRTPGRTQQINFFELGGRLMLADLPGYGYARAPKAKIAAWIQLTEDYLKGRPRLRRVYLLLDARHGPKASDRNLMALLGRCAMSYQIVLTKADKASETALAALLKNFQRELAGHAAAHPDIHVTSARKGRGIAELKAALAALAAPAEPR